MSDRDAIMLNDRSSSQRGLSCKVRRPSSPTTIYRLQHPLTLPFIPCERSNMRTTRSKSKNNKRGTLPGHRLPDVDACSPAISFTLQEKALSAFSTCRHYPAR